jgi:hypothetical protein
MQKTARLTKKLFCIDFKPYSISKKAGFDFVEACFFFTHEAWGKTLLTS